MIKDYDKTLSGLEQSIINKINKLEKRKLFLKQSVYEIISFISFIGIIFSTIYIIRNLSSSGIYGYISLIFSDVETLSYWKELSLSILESLPFFGLAIGLGILGIFLWSILKTIKIQMMKNSMIGSLN